MRYKFRMPKADISPRSSKKQGDDELRMAALTRDDVAKRLGVSISTVRRLEGRRLHPAIDSNSVRRFKASDVERLAKEIEAEQRSPRNAQQAVVRAAEMSRGELAALVFEKLEQRHSLSEIVIALRVPPEDVPTSTTRGFWAFGAVSCSGRNPRFRRSTLIRTRSGESRLSSSRSYLRRCRRRNRRASASLA